MLSNSDSGPENLHLKDLAVCSSFSQWVHFNIVFSLHIIDLGSDLYHRLFIQYTKFTSSDFFLLNIILNLLSSLLDPSNPSSDNCPNPNPPLRSMSSQAWESTLWTVGEMIASGNQARRSLYSWWHISLNAATSFNSLLEL